MSQAPRRSRGRRKAPRSAFGDPSLEDPAKRRVKGVQIYRPFIFGSIAKVLDPTTRPPNINTDHTHQWTVYIRPVAPTSPLTYWLRKVTFKLHDTYTNSIRTIEAPQPFEVTETGWGEFHVTMKLYFAPEAMEKPQTIWHELKLHPYGPNAEEMRKKGEVVSQCYEEVLFSEPVEALYDILTGGRGEAPQSVRGGKTPGSGKGKGRERSKGERTAEIPYAESKETPFSQKTEVAELDRLAEAFKTVERQIVVEKEKLAERERELEELRTE